MSDFINISIPQEISRATILPDINSSGEFFQFRIFQFRIFQFLGYHLLDIHILYFYNQSLPYFSLPLGSSIVVELVVFLFFSSTTAYYSPTT